MNYSTLIKHPHVLMGIAAAGAIALASFGYYMLGARTPQADVAATPAQQGDIVAQGTVTAIDNPELAFAQGGRVAGVYVKEGDRVAAGQVLATTDAGGLAANLAGAQAKLAQMSSPSAADLATAQTTVAQAQQSLTTLYDSLPASVLDAQSKAQSAIYVTIAPLVGGQGTQGQQFAFASDNAQNDQRVGREYDQIELIIQAWNNAQGTLDSASAQQKESALADTLDKMRAVRTLLTDLSTLLVNANPNTFGEGMTVEQARSDVITASASVNASISALTALQSSIASAKLGVQNAQTALQKTQQGSRPEDLAAQRAVVSAAAAALRQAQIVAPFAGTVASVAVKQGDIVAPDAQAVSLLPDGQMQVDMYVSELDVTRLAAGQLADIALDAYPGRNFVGTVAGIDQAPSPSGVQGATGYKVTIALPKDPAITVGMHANVTIHAAAAAQ
jgi:multidrug efflux pump subunit AcrA (membrane-fusion protein)